MKKNNNNIINNIIGDNIIIPIFIVMYINYIIISLFYNPHLYILKKG